MVELLTILKLPVVEAALLAVVAWWSQRQIKKVSAVVTQVKENIDTEVSKVKNDVDNIGAIVGTEKGLSILAKKVKEGKNEISRDESSGRVRKLGATTTKRRANTKTTKRRVSRGR